MNDYLIWSNEHCAWWGPDHCGYVTCVEDAGRYSHAEALNICIDAMPGRTGKEPLHELPVRLIDIQFMLEQFRNNYPRP